MEIAEEVKDILQPLRKFPGLYKPNYRRNIFQVLPTILWMTGVKTDRKSLSDDGKCRRMLENSECGDAENVVFFLIDSCGIQQFAMSKELKRLFYELGPLPLSSVFPTTTSVAITSLACGLPPQDHGVLGHKIYIEEMGALVDTLRASVANRPRDSLYRAGIDLEKMLWSRPLYSELPEEIIYAELLQWGIAKTGLSHFLGIEGITLGFVNLIDAFSMLKKLLEKYEGRKLIVQVYIHTLDSLGHKYGPYSKEFRMGLRSIEQLIVRFIRGLRGRVRDRTVIAMLSDHGQDRIDAQKIVSLTKEEAKSFDQFMVTKPGVSGRVRHFYVVEDHADEFVTAIEDRIQARCVLLSFEEVEKNLLGEVRDRGRTMARIGNYVLVPFSGCEVRVEREEPKMEPLLKQEYVSSHGSLALNEITVPFLAGRVPTIRRVLG